MEKLDIKLIAIDLDHTLISFGKKDISSFDFQTIQKAKQQNVNVSIFTGRSVERSFFYSEFLNLKYHVSFGGSLIYSLKPKKIIKYYAFSKKQVEKMINDNVFDHSNLFITFYTLDLQSNTVKSYYYGIKNDAFTFHQINLDSFEKITSLAILLSFPLIRINIFSDINSLQKTTQNLQKISQANIILNYQTVLEITPFGVDKGVALQFLQKKLAINKHHTMTIGDSANDIPMFNQAKYGIAVANADPSLKKIAFGHTTSFDKFGVAQALLKWVIK